MLFSMWFTIACIYISLGMIFVAYVWSACAIPINMIIEAQIERMHREDKARGKDYRHLISIERALYLGVLVIAYIVAWPVFVADLLKDGGDDDDMPA